MVGCFRKLLVKWFGFVLGIGLFFFVEGRIVLLVC